VNPQPPLRSGAFARLAGVSPDTLRLYERKGLLHSPERSGNGYRRYSPESLKRVRLIRAALSIGFTLNELAQILKVRDDGGAPCHKVRDLAEAKLKRLEERIRELVVLRKRMRNILKNWDQILKQTPERQRAELLQRLVSSGSEKGLKLPPYLLAAMTREV
jgi:DNA-binding transcriptional MerR regulator